jgi:hypothetical protein
MSTGSPNYFSCARCGWRGILGVNEAHECASEKIVGSRRATQVASAVVAASAQAQPESRPKAEDRFGVAQAIKLESQATELLGRNVGVTLEATKHVYNVHQRCNACRSSIMATIRPFDTDGYIAVLAMVGTRANREWLMHKCRPVERSLDAIPTEDLGELYEQLEVESGRLAQRAIDVKRVLDERFAKERS